MALNAEEVFLIIYQDGEVLKIAQGSSATDQPKKLTVIKTGRFKRDSLIILESDGVLFCGFDFSFFRLVNPLKIGTDEDVNRYIGNWNAYLRDKLEVAKLLDKAWRENRHHDLFNPDNKPERLVYSSPTEDHSIDQYLDVVARYDLTTKEKRFYSVGLTIFPVEFNKIEEKVHCRFVFFNPETLDIYWTLIATGNTGCCGMSGHWADGVYDSVKNLTRFIRNAKKNSGY